MLSLTGLVNQVSRRKCCIKDRGGAMARAGGCRGQVAFYREGPSGPCAAGRGEMEGKAGKGRGEVFSPQKKGFGEFCALSKLYLGK